MSTLAKIIYEETGISQSSAPDEYEEIASACRRFALHCDPRHPLTREAIDAIIKSNFVSINDQNLYDAIYLCMRDVESAHDIEEQK